LLCEDGNCLRLAEEAQNIKLRSSSNWQSPSVPTGQTRPRPDDLVFKRLRHEEVDYLTANIPVWRDQFKYQNGRRRPAKDRN
jgi:hypothetical protein